MKKQDLRQLYTAKRNALSQAEYNDLNQALLRQFRALDLQEVNCIHLFLPIHKRKEPDTFLIRDWLRNTHPHLKRVFPKADFADNTMQHFADDAGLQLAINAFGIPEPLTGNTVNPTEIDLVLIPLLTFDRRGYRVGYGKGFYDRFLAQCRPDAQLVGLSFFEPAEEIEDVNAFDRPMHKCITPEGKYIFNNP